MAPIVATYDWLLVNTRATPPLDDLREAMELLRGPLTSDARAGLPDPTPPEGPDPYGNPDPEWLRVEWSKHLGTVDARGARVNYVELGEPEAPPLVLVHGLAGCWQNWLETIPQLSRTHRVLALDLPGSGHSPMPPWEISIPAYAELLRDFCDELGVSSAAVAGNSMGGLIAAEAAGGEPGRVTKLALVAAAGISHAELRPEPAALAGRLALGIGPLAVRLQERALRRPRLRQVAFGSVFHDPGALRRELLFEHYTNGSGRPGFLSSLVAVAGYEFTERLEKLDTPALVVWGRDDRVVPAADAVGYGSALRNSQTVILDRTGHVPQLERPVRFNRLLETFLGGA